MHLIDWRARATFYRAYLSVQGIALSVGARWNLYASRNLALKRRVQRDVLWIPPKADKYRGIRVPFEKSRSSIRLINRI